MTPSEITRPEIAKFGNDEYAFSDFYSKYRIKCEKIGTAEKPIYLKLDLQLNKEWKGLQDISFKLSKPELSIKECDDGFWEISGTPLKEGVIELEIKYNILSESKQLLNVSRQFPLAQVSVSPRSLWKDLKTDPKGEYFCNDTDNIDIAANEKFEKNIMAASRRGRSHAHKGTFRDDNFKCTVLDSGWAIMAVSDGAGSAEFSRKGSLIACEAFVNKAKELLEHEKLREQFSINNENQTTIEETAKKIMWNAAYECYRKVYDEATSKNRSIKKYAATLLAVITKKIGNAWFGATVFVGDGIIGLLAKDGKIQLLSEPDGGEQVGETRFISMPEIWGNSDEESRKKFIESRTRTFWTNDFDCLMAMTDGVSDPIFGTDSGLKEEATWSKLRKEIFEALESSPEKNNSEKLLDWLNFYIESHHDDRTIAILH